MKSDLVTLLEHRPKTLSLRELIDWESRVERKIEENHRDLDRYLNTFYDPQYFYNRYALSLQDGNVIKYYEEHRFHVGYTERERRVRIVEEQIIGKDPNVRPIYLAHKKSIKKLKDFRSTCNPTRVSSLSEAESLANEAAKMLDELRKQYLENNTPESSDELEVDKEE